MSWPIDLCQSPVLNPVQDQSQDQADIDMARKNAVVSEIASERTNLATHVDLCVERYGQIVDRLDSMDEKFHRIETMVLEIKDAVQRREESTLNRYVSWAGVLISGLAGAVVALAVLLIK